MPARLASSCPGTASASGRWVQQTRWTPTDLPSLAISQSRPLAACWAARAALSSPRSRQVSSATSSTTTSSRDQLGGAAGGQPRRPVDLQVADRSNRGRKRPRNAALRAHVSEA